MNEHISVMTDFGELIATPFAGGISVDINLPDGKGSGQLAFIESTPAELQDDYPTPVHVFSYDGRDSEPVRGEWKSDRIDLYTPQDCFGFSDPFGGRIEYSEKKPEIAVAVKPDPVELGHRASVAASSTAGGRARGAGIRQ